MIKRFAAVFLALLMCLGVAGCAKKDKAPKGMERASIEGEPFIMYVPEAWTPNIVSGVSSAYYSTIDNIAVSARYFTPENAEMTVDEYVQQVKTRYSEGLELFNLLAEESSILGGTDARELKYTAKYREVEYTYRQVFAKYKGDIISVSFHCPTARFAELTAQFDQITAAFVLCESTEPVNDCVTDKKTPSGMKIASCDNVEYRLYVPQTWVCNSESGVSEAYYDESGRPNVTVTSYSPDETMSAEEYFAECEAEYRKNISGYELISSEQRTVAERSAYSYTYRAAYGNVSFKLMQTVLVYNGLVYSITYTAYEESFDAHLDDVNTILNSFRFR